VFLVKVRSFGISTTFFSCSSFELESSDWYRLYITVFCLSKGKNLNVTIPLSLTYDKTFLLLNTLRRFLTYEISKPYSSDNCLSAGFSLQTDFLQKGTRGLVISAPDFARHLILLSIIISVMWADIGTLSFGTKMLS